jgi:hypothetical protein
MKKVAYLGITPLIIGLILNGCSSREAKPEMGVKSSIISGYLTENGAKIKGSSIPCDQGVNCGYTESADPENAKTGYEKERDRMLAKIVKTSPTPMRVPDTVLRVLVLPYVDDSGTLTAQNYKFTKVDDGKWILGEYLVKEGSAIKMLTPLTNDILSEGSAAPKQEKNQQEQTQQSSPNMIPTAQKPVSDQMGGE